MLATDRLIKLRKSKKLTQKEVALNIGIERTTFVRYEKGNIQPPTDIVKRLADFFSVTTDYLLGRTSEPAPAPTNLSDLPCSDLEELLNSGKITLDDIPIDGADTGFIIDVIRLGLKKAAKDKKRVWIEKN